MPAKDLEAIFHSDTRKMKGYLFFLVTMVIVVIIWKVSGSSSSGATIEKFVDVTEETPEGASPGLNIPLISPRQQTLQKGEVKDFAPPSTELLAPPPGQLASVNSRPAEDPALQKAGAGRLQSVYESLNSFYRNEEPGLRSIGDPSVQLPLSTAKSDKARLQDELDVLKRNPGLKSSITEEDLNGIESNLGYLQKKWRMSVNSGTVSPMPPSQEEGFLNMGSSSGRGWFQTFFGGSSEYYAQEGFQTSTNAGSNAGSNVGSNAKTTTSDITLLDLENLSLKLNAEIIRLQSSGSTDLNTQYRVMNLSTTLRDINDLIDDIKNGKKKVTEIGFMKKDLNAYLSAMSSTTAELPKLLVKTNSILSSLFSPYSTGDLSGAETAAELFQEYANTLLNNLSWDVNLKYKGNAEQEIAKNYAKAMMEGKMMAEHEAEAAKINAAGPGPVDEVTKNAYRGMFESIIKDITGGYADASVSFGGKGKGSGSSGDSGSGIGTTTEEEGKGFNWKSRSKHICEQISKRGMDPNDFGCMKDHDGEKYSGFSWRGYAKMVCNRLSTVYDPSVPELCGCPPPTWQGWRA